MKLAIIGGTGRMGQSLAMRSIWAGNEVIIGSRAPSRARLVAETIDVHAQGMSNSDAAATCDLAILTVPYSAHYKTLQSLRVPLSGKLVLDTTVPIDPENALQTRTDSGSSAAEEAAEILEAGTKVFAAFQNVSFHTLRDKDLATDILVAGPKDYKDAAVNLIEGCFGLRAIYTGPLSIARHLEQLTLLLISVNRHHKVKNSAIRILGIS